MGTKVPDTLSIFQKGAKRKINFDVHKFWLDNGKHN